MTSRTRQRLFPPMLGGPLALFVVFVLPLAVAPHAEAFVYWTNIDWKPRAEDTGAIARASLDGTDTNQDFIAFEVGDEFSFGDVARGGGHLYWTESDLIPDDSLGHYVSSIGRAKIAGTGVKRRLIGGLPAYAQSLAVAAEHVYWAWNVWDFGTGLAQSTGIGRANLDGTGVDQHFIDLDASGLGLGDIAADSGHVYWTNAAANEAGIGRANLDGTGVDQHFITSAGSPRGVGVDAEHIYWTMSYTGDVAGCCGNAIGSANLDGSAVDQRLIDGGVGLKPPFWGDLEADGSHLYWTVSESNLGIDEIVRANLDGTGATTLIPDGDRPIAGLAVDGLTDAKLSGRASASGTQRQTGKRIVVKVKVKAKERLTAKATGKVRVKPTYKLKPQKEKLAAGEIKTLRLKPKKARAKKIANALKGGAKGKAKLKVKLTDLVGNSESERLRVRLRR